MVLNRQKTVVIDLGNVRAFVRRLKATLKLGRRDFNICFIDDGRMAQLNGRYRKKPRPTDVLSFSWTTVARVGACPDAGRDPRRPRRAGARVYDPQRVEVHKARVIDPRYSGEFAGFMGDVVISAPTARRNARAAGHSTAREIRWLVLHGVLHLVGYDHATDRGEMTALELSLRERLCRGKR